MMLISFAVKHKQVLRLSRRLSIDSSVEEARNEKEARVSQRERKRKIEVEEKGESNFPLERRRRSFERRRFLLRESPGL